ncbi:hypothetical protein [Siphonobacter sp. SORGH_AS_0500]|uniref:hypothetical protein n=1 Tax=Siphonobacter sp. SORGH_AS_0500 TaxID=1864824 RepID=UPI00285500E1|nr:hypothetical protein [Siphonobacter sp. SORGH_AS_0500]MDR6197142.1 hypothetical protein [Siphonobacter sp. SORGH_AS_0500]
MSMIRFVLCLTIALFLTACSSTKNWQGNSNDESTQAEFKELNGKQHFILRVPSNDTYLSYRFTTAAGALQASIKSASGFVFNDKIKSLEEKRIHVVNQKGATYKVMLEGNQASGTMDVRFVSSNL